MTRSIARLAECYWKVGQVNDLVNERLRASESFLLASHDYGIAEQNSPHLAEFYRHYATYMEAWSEIEKARYFHDHQQHSAAETSYRKTTERLSSSSRWAFLSPNYAAWAELEHAEDLFAGHREEEGIKALDEAIQLLQSSGEFLRQEMRKSQDVEWRGFLSKLIDASAAREASCRRVVKERTQSVEKKLGDHSSGRVVQATEIETTPAIVDIPEPTLETPLGIERFEHASVESKLILGGRMVRPGQNLEVCIAIVNVGRHAAQLVRLDDAIPEGLASVDVSGKYEVESAGLNLKGKRLGPLETEEVKLVLKPQNQGLFIFKPRVVYVDENRQPRTNEPHPEKVLVSPVVEYLAECFALDYNRAGLSLEHAGWRTLMDIVGSLKISRSQVYGDQKSGSVFAKPLRKLVEAGLVEARIFLGQRGRGGRVVKVRIRHDNDEVRKFLEELGPVSMSLGSFSLRT